MPELHALSNGRIRKLSRDVAVTSPEDAHCSATASSMWDICEENRRFASSGDIIMDHTTISESGDRDRSQLLESLNKKDNGSFCRLHTIG